MKAKRFLATFLVALLVVSLSLSLFACNGGTLEEVLNSDSELSTLLNDFLGTSNVSFKYKSQDEETVTVVSANASDNHRTSAADITYKLTSNKLDGVTHYNTELLYVFYPRNIFTKQTPVDEWNDLSKGEFSRTYIDTLFANSIFPTLEEGETLTIQKLFGSNPQINSIFSNANFKIKKFENNTYYIEDISKTYNREESLQYIKATEEILERNNVTVHTLDITVAFKDISFTATDNKISKVCFTAEVNADMDMSKGEERDHRIGVATSICEYEFYDYGTTTIIDDPTDIKGEVTEEVWNAQVEQFAYDKLLSFTGTGIGFKYVEKEGNTTQANIACLINPNYVYLEQTSPSREDAYYVISSVDETKITYTRYLYSSTALDGEAYLAVSDYSKYYKEEETEDSVADPTSAAFSGILFASHIAGQLEFENFTFSEDHYESTGTVQITDGPELSNIKVYFNNNLLTKITYTSTMYTEVTEVTITFGYGFKLPALRKAPEATTTT